MTDTFSITLDPTEIVRTDALKRLEEYFALLAVANGHKDLAYARKRQIAGNLDNVTPDFVQEAILRKLSIEDLAQLVLSKPDTIGEREMQRQLMKASIEQETDANKLKTWVESLKQMRLGVKP